MKERFLEKSTFFFMMASPLFGFITVILWLICKILNIPDESIFVDLIYVSLFAWIGFSIIFLLLFIISYF